MKDSLKLGETFPDIELTDHEGAVVKPVRRRTNSWVKSG
jgi:hypothetical protein